MNCASIRTALMRIMMTLIISDPYIIKLQDQAFDPSRFEANSVDHGLPNRAPQRNATMSEAIGRRTHNGEYRIIDTHYERHTYGEYFQTRLRRCVSQHKRTNLICVPSTFGSSALVDPWYRERRLVTMNTTSGCSMQKCLKASTSARHTTQHKPQFGSARGGLPIQWLRLITPRKGTSKFPVKVYAFRTANT